MEVAVRQYMASTFPALDINSADVSINEDGEAEIAVSTGETKATAAPKKVAQSNGRARKKAEAKPEAVEATVEETVTVEVAAEDVPASETITVTEPTTDEATVPFGLEDTSIKPARSLFTQ